MKYKPGRDQNVSEMRVDCAFLVSSLALYVPGMLIFVHREWIGHRNRDYATSSKSGRLDHYTGSTICSETLYFVDCESADRRSEKNFRLK